MPGTGPRMSVRCTRRPPWPPHTPAQPVVPDIAFVEHQAGSLYLDNGDEAPYVRMYEDLTGMASSPADSAAFIRDVRASLPCRREAAR